MLVRHVEIENFRGIRKLSWHISGRVICLVGPCDSTKTTILDAIELALLPRWQAQLSDADFYKADTSKNICIRVTVGELPDDMVTDDRCGLFLRGYRAGKDIADDPEDGWEQVITVQLEVTNDLEPSWTLIKPSAPEPKKLSYREREKLVVARLGSDVDRHLSWSRGSALARITENGASTAPMLAIANRAATEAIAGKSHEELEVVSEKAREAATRFGVQLSELKPGLDTYSLPIGSAALALHDDSSLPLRTLGLGSRRLTGLAIQQSGLGRSAILLVDEIEHGLEPHRIRRLLRALVADGEEGSKSSKTSGQVLMTTHSPTPIMALDVADLRFVRSERGETIVQEASPSLTSSLQPIVRTLGHALLARKIIVCEGKTEEALCRSLDLFWSKRHAEQSLAYQGVVAVNGNGRDSGPKTAREFSRLGYCTCYFGDSDEPLGVSADELETGGVQVSIWPGELATEERLASDLPLTALQDFIDSAIELKGKESVLDAVGHHLDKQLHSIGTAVSDWIEGSASEDSVRLAIGRAAKKTLGGWFKDLNAGEVLGSVIIKVLPDIEDTDTASTLAALESWAYGE